MINATHKLVYLNTWCCLGVITEGGAASLKEACSWGQALRGYSRAPLPAHLLCFIEAVEMLIS